MNCELMQPNEQIVRPLPRDKGVMAKVQHAGVRIHVVFQNANHWLPCFSACFETRPTDAPGTPYPDANQRPLLPVQPLPPILPVLPIPPR